MNNAATKDLRAEVGRALDEVRALRDEARLKIHLGSMDARAAWARLEPTLERAEREATKASIEGLRQIEATLKKLRELVASL